MKVKESVPEIALILALTCLPRLTVALGKFVSHSFFGRYAIAAMFGVVGLIALIIWRAGPGKVASVAVMLLFCSTFAYTAMRDMQQARDERTSPSRERMQKRISSIVWQDQLPIAFAGDTHPFLDLSYYGNSALLRRMCYLASPEYELLYEGANNGDLSMIESAPYFGTNVVDYRTWTKSHRVFYLVSGEGTFAVTQLIHDGARLELVQGDRINFVDHAASLFRVTMPGQ